VVIRRLSHRLTSGWDLSFTRVQGLCWAVQRERALCMFRGDRGDRIEGGLPDQATGEIMLDRVAQLDLRQVVQELVHRGARRDLDYPPLGDEPSTSIDIHSAEYLAVRLRFGSVVDPASHLNGRCLVGRVDVGDADPQFALTSPSSKESPVLRPWRPVAVGLR
jgi:hypothetical protein